MIGFGDDARIFEGDALEGDGDLACRGLVGEAACDFAAPDLSSDCCSLLLMPDQNASALKGCCLSPREPIWGEAATVTTPSAGFFGDTTRLTALGDLRCDSGMGLQSPPQGSVFSATLTDGERDLGALSIWNMNCTESSPPTHLVLRFGEDSAPSLGEAIPASGADARRDTSGDLPRAAKPASTTLLGDDMATGTKQH